MTKIFVATIAITAVSISRAFTHSSLSRNVNSVSGLKMASEVVSETMPEAPLPEEPEEPKLPEMSQSMPFMKRPAALTGELAGDVGFDPVGFAKSEVDLMNYREAEVKHARLAMLAAAGWPLSEVFDKKIAAGLGMVPVLDATDRAPSILNGGMGKISPVYWVGCLAVAAAIDVLGIMRAKSAKESGATYLPGDYGFDPLGVYPKNEEGQKWMQLAEIKNGRLAMIAVTAFGVQEFVSKSGVVNETPLFFFPIQETLHQYANSGYIQ